MKNMGMGEDVVLGRGEPIPDTLPASSGKGEDGQADDAVLTEFPIYVCVPEDEVRGRERGEKEREAKKNKKSRFV